MFKVTREGNKVTLRIEYIVDGSRFFTDFSTNYSCELSAAAARETFCGALRGRLESIRREAYNNGWKDKSSKLPKKQFFSGALGD